MQGEKIWQAVLGELQLQVSKANYNTWLKDTRGLDCSGGTFTVAVPTEFMAEWLKSRLQPVICRILTAITGNNIEVQFQVQAVSRPPAAKPGLMPDGGTSLKVRVPVSGHGHLNPKYTFSTFAPGECNHLPFTTASEIASNPGQSFNPFYIYGGTGTGKTHLLHAIGHAAALKNLAITYMNAEQFTNEFIAAIRSRKAEEFRYKFSRIDLFLLDDIQFLSGKTSTQECIFHIINDLLSEGRQVAITGDRPPREMTSFNVRLLSRIEGGLVTNVQPPDHKMRLAIIELKSRVMQTSFDAAVADFLASNFFHSVRELEGAVIRLATSVRLNSSQMDLFTAKILLGDMISVCKQSAGPHPAAEVIRAVADFHAMSPDDITGKKRDLKTSRARHVTMYLLRQQNHCSLSDIGKILGNRDHSTVIHGCQKIAAEINVDSQLSRSIEEIRMMLKSSNPS